MVFITLNIVNGCRHTRARGKTHILYIFSNKEHTYWSISIYNYETEETTRINAFNIPDIILDIHNSPEDVAVNIAGDGLILEN